MNEPREPTDRPVNGDENVHLGMQIACGATALTGKNKYYHNSIYWDGANSAPFVLLFAGLYWTVYGARNV
jgi:hypothetical protein